MMLKAPSSVQTAVSLRVGKEVPKMGCHSPEVLENAIEEGGTGTAMPPPPLTRRIPLTKA